MTISRVWSRIGAAVGAATLVTAIAATPARAVDQPEVWASLSIGDVPADYDESSGGLPGRLYIGYFPHPDLPEILTVEIDASGVDGVVIFRTSDDACTAADLITTCVLPLPDPEDESPALRFNLIVAPGASVGDSGEIVLTVSGEGLAPVVEVETITIVEPYESPELWAQSYTFDDPVSPGQIVSYRPMIHNAANRATAQQVVIELWGDEYAELTQRFSNCYYDPEYRDHATCLFDFTLAPGETARVTEDSAVQLRIAPDVPHRQLIFAGYDVTGTDSWFELPDGEPGDGPPLTLELVSGEEFTGDSFFASVRFTAGDHATDLAAVGADLPDSVGSSTVVEVGITNHGPAALAARLPGEGMDTTPHVVITFPDGVTVEEILPPEGDLQYTSGCYPPDGDGNPDWSRRNQVDGQVYLCSVSEFALRPGDSWLFPFRVKVTDPTTGAGSVTVFEGPNDPNLSNNTAAITFGGGGGGGLPITGTTTVLIAIAGVVVLAGGIGLYLFSRKRRVTFSSDD